MRNGGKGSVQSGLTCARRVLARVKTEANTPARMTHTVRRTSSCVWRVARAGINSGLIGGILRDESLAVEEHYEDSETSRYAHSGESGTPRLPGGPTAFGWRVEGRRPDRPPRTRARNC